MVTLINFDHKTQILWYRFYTKRFVAKFGIPKYQHIKHTRHNINISINMPDDDNVDTDFKAFLDGILKEGDAAAQRYQ